MGEVKLLKRGARANTYSKVFIVVQLLVCFSLICGLSEDKQSWTRFSRNALIVPAALASFNIETLMVFIAGLIGFNFIVIGALILALLAWLRYKNEKARPTVALAVGVIIASSLLALASWDFFS
jgi:hypothetical protein